MGRFQKDTQTGERAYREARAMRNRLATTQPKPTKDERHVIYEALGRLQHTSARTN